MRSVTESQYGYCSLVWMLCGTKASSRIHRALEKAVWTIDRSHIITFEELGLGKSCNMQQNKKNNEIDEFKNNF